MLVLAVGALAPIQLQLVGEIYAPELLLPLVAVCARFSPGGERGLREPLFAVLLLAAFITLGGYVLSDTIRGTRPDQFLRGWGRVGLVILDFISLAVLFCQDRRNLWWFALGSGIGGILYLRFVTHAPLALWKFGYADSVLEASAALGTILPLRLASAWIALLGVFSMIRDFRSFGAICFLIAGCLWIRSARPLQPLAGSREFRRLFILGLIAATVILITLFLTAGGATGRRAQSDAGRLAAIEVGIVAIMRSPVIGYGSWPEDRDLATLYMTRLAQLLGGGGPVEVGNKIVISPHSQILHAWMEGGILGSALFVALFWQVMRLGRWSVLHRPVDPFTPVVLYLLMFLLWDMFMSPFAAPHRLGIAAGAAVLVALRMERRVATGPRREPAGSPETPARPSAWTALTPKPRRRALVMARNALRMKPSTRKSLLR
jgi:hypothetical protein